MTEALGITGSYTNAKYTIKISNISDQHSPVLQHCIGLSLAKLNGG